MSALIWTVAKMKAWEDEQNRTDLNYARMMEHAGSRAATDLMNRFSYPQHTLVLCGRGNNAGDGLVLARILSEHHWPVTIMWLQGQQLSPLAEVNRARLPAAVVYTEPMQLNKVLPEMQLIVDAVY